MTQEEIRKTWMEGSRRINNLDERDIELLVIQKKETALDRLRTKYRRFTIFGLIMAVISFQWIYAGKRIFDDNTTGIIVSIVFCCYFIGCAIVDYFLLRGVSAIDCLTMTVSEVAERALHYRKLHLRSVMIILPFAFACLALFAYAFKELRAGIIFGAILGIIIGSFQLKEFMAQYKELTK